MTNNSEMKFRDWLRQEMETRGMSQAELARLSKVPQPTIQRILSGETPDPRGSTIDKIKAILGEAPASVSPALPVLTPDQLMIAEMYVAVPDEKKADMLDQMAKNPDRYKALLDALLTEVSRTTVRASDRRRAQQPLADEQEERRKKNA